MKGYKQLVVVGILILAVAVASSFIGYSVGKKSARPWEPHRKQIERSMHQRLPSELSRTERAGKFEKVLASRKQQIHQRLARLKEEDPKKYREVIQKQINKLETALERLKQEMPQTTPK